MRYGLTRAAIPLTGMLLSAQAQWLNHPDPRTPRTHDGKPVLAAPAPRLNGKPDLSGVWQAERGQLNGYKKGPDDDPLRLQVDLLDVSNQIRNVFWGMKREEEPLKPEAVAVLAQRGDNAEFPPVRCLPFGVPGDMFVYAFKIIQTPQEIVVLTEAGDPPRQIYMDGRSLPNDPQPSWMGYSVGKWQGDTLVVETTGFKEEGWLDGTGHPRSQSMHITERLRRRDFGHIDLEITFEDAKYYTRSFMTKTVLNLLPDTDILEFVCTENEKDRIHMGNQ